MSRPFLCVTANLLVAAAISGLSVAYPQEVSPAKPLTVAEESALKPKDSFKECDVCPEMVVVPAGSFTMGSSQVEIEDLAEEVVRQRWRDRKGAVALYKTEGPQRQVHLARPFAVGKYEVTFAEWDACVAAGGCNHRPYDSGRGRGKQPVTHVSWNDITNEYLPWLSRKTGKDYRLLTEAEWEYAARAGTTTPFSTGTNIKRSQARFRDFGGPVDVGSFPPNAFGLHDMHGNVWEWVQDCGNASYVGAPTDGSAWTDGDCFLRVLRGGGWTLPPLFLRSAARERIGSSYPDFTGTRGFRVARTLIP